MYKRNTISTIALSSLMAASPLSFSKGIEHKLEQIPANEQLISQQEQKTLKDVYKDLSDLLEKHYTAVKNDQPDASVDAQRKMHEIVEMLNITYNLGADIRNAKLEYDGKIVTVIYKGILPGSPLNGKVDYVEFKIGPDGTAYQTTVSKGGGKVTLPLPAANIVR